MSDATTYDGLVTILAGLCVVPPNDPDFQTELPDALAYANNRMCRDIDFLTTRTAQSGPTLSVGVGTFTLSGIAQIVVLENLAVITPAGQISPLTRQTEAYIETMYPYSWIGFPAPTSARGLPVDFSLLDGLNVFIGPAPDLAYLDVYGRDVSPGAAIERQRVAVDFAEPAGNVRGGVHGAAEWVDEKLRRHRG